MGSQYFGEQSLKNNPSKASMAPQFSRSASNYMADRFKREDSLLIKSDSLRDISAIEKILAKRKTEIFGNLEGQEQDKNTLPILVPQSNTTKSDQPSWQRTWNPTDRPNDKKEVAYLSQQLDHMLQEIGISPNDDHRGSDESFSVSKIEQEQKIYDTILNDITRQVYVECKDRGVLLGRVNKRYRNLFYRVPTLLYQIQGEIDSLADANKSLRTLLEKLMKEKSSAESDLHAYTTRLVQTENENSTIRTHLVESLSQARSLKEEKEEFVLDLRRLEENLQFQRNLHKQLQNKDQENDATIQQLTAQLQDAISRLQLLEDPKNK